jgi:hypothetical protein
MIKMTSLSSSKREKPLVKKAKKGRPRSENPMAHTAVVLPTDLIARLKADAEVKGQGLSAEIRDRLAATYFNQGSSSDRETKNFLEAVRKLADLLARDLGTRWYEHSYARWRPSKQVWRHFSRVIYSKVMKVCVRIARVRGGPMTHPTSLDVRTLGSYRLANHEDQ